MPVRRSLNQLKISYFLSVFVIIGLLATTQIIIQLTLYKEVRVSTLARLIDQQEVRTQRMFYAVILLQNPPGHGVNYGALDKTVESETPAWEATQNALYGQKNTLGVVISDLPVDALRVIGSTKPDYLAMDGALHRIFLLEKRQTNTTPDKVRPDVGIYYIHESAYLESLIAIYGDLISETNIEIFHIQLTEVSLFTLSILTVLAEYLFVARPGMDSVKDAFLQLQEAMNDIEGHK